MNKKFFHKISFPGKLLLTAVLICLFFSSKAQDENIGIVDSVAVYETETEPEYHFDPLTETKMPAYKPYSIHDSIIQNLKKDEAFWYVDKAPGRKETKEQGKQPQGDPFYFKAWFRTLIWTIIIIAFVGILAWFLIASDVRLFRRKPSAVEGTAGDFLPDDIFSIDYDKEMEKAVAGRNYNLGVRLMYLHTLKLMSEKEIIDYREQKTNSDYLFQLYNSPYYKDFFRLTRNFEYVWYGQFVISETSYDRIGQDYRTLKSRLQ